jgi:hypothetical protein
MLARVGGGFAISGVGVKHNSRFRIIEEEFTHAE